MITKQSIFSPSRTRNFWLNGTTAVPLEEEVPYFVPTRTGVWNNLDDLGSLCGLDRLEDETNLSFKERILASGFAIANSSHRGMLRGVCRDLGLAFQPILEIDVLNTPLPEIVLSPLELKIYQNYLSLTENEVITSMPYFSASSFQIFGIISLFQYLSLNLTVLDERFNYYPSYHLVPDTLRKWDLITTGTGTRHVSLGQKPIVIGSLLVQLSNIFYNEVDTPTNLLKNGDYWIDYVNGVVQTFSIIDQPARIAFQYYDNPLKVYFSGVALLPVQDFANAPQFFDSQGLPGSEILRLTENLKRAAQISWGP